MKAFILAAISFFTLYTARAQEDPAQLNRFNKVLYTKSGYEDILPMSLHVISDSQYIVSSTNFLELDDQDTITKLVLQLTFINKEGEMDSFNYIGHENEWVTLYGGCDVKNDTAYKGFAILGMRRRDTPAAPYHWVVWRFSPKGELLWESELFATAYMHYPSAIYAYHDGGFLITGTQLYKQPQGTDGVIVKINNNGKQQWIARTGLTGTDRGGNIEYDSLDNIVYNGHIVYNADQFPPPLYSNTSSLTWYLNNDGQTLRLVPAKESGYERVATYFDTLTDTTFWGIVYNNRTVEDSWTYVKNGEHTLPRMGTYHYLSFDVATFDTAGNRLSRQVYAYPPSVAEKIYVVPRHFLTLPDHSAITGHQMWIEDPPEDLLEDYYAPHTENWSIQINRLNHKGEFLWRRSLSPHAAYFNLLLDMKPTPDGGYLFLGMHDDIQPDGGRGVPANRLIWLVKTDSLGCDKPGGGCTDYLPPPTPYDTMKWYLPEDTIGIQQAPRQPIGGLAIYPNPTGGSFTIELPRDAPHRALPVELLSMEGKLVHSFPPTAPVEGRLRLQVPPSMPAGSYILNYMVWSGRIFIER